jgi:hypothetical protein
MTSLNSPPAWLHGKNRSNPVLQCDKKFQAEDIVNFITQFHRWDARLDGSLRSAAYTMVRARNWGLTWWRDAVDKYHRQTIRQLPRPTRESVLSRGGDIPCSRYYVHLTVRYNKEIDLMVEVFVFFRINIVACMVPSISKYKIGRCCSLYIMLLQCIIIVIFGDTLYHDVKVTVCALCVSLWLISLWTVGVCWNHLVRLRW